MAAKIGILGESTVVSNSTTTTLYTVPADKASRVRVLVAVEGAGGDACTCLIDMGTPGSEITMNLKSSTGGVDFFSGPVKVTGTQAMPSSGIGIQGETGGIDMSTATADTQRAFTLFPHDYYLSTGDTCTVRNNGGTDWDDTLTQFQGVEDDA